MISTVEQTLHTVLSGKGTIGRLITEDTLINQLQELGRRANSLAGKSGKTISSADVFINNLNGLAGQGGSFMDSLTLLVQKTMAALEKADSVLQDVKSISGQLPETMVQVRDDLSEAENMMKAVQNSWIFRKALLKSVMTHCWIRILMKRKFNVFSLCFVPLFSCGGRKVSNYDRTAAAYGRSAYNCFRDGNFAEAKSFTAGH